MDKAKIAKIVSLVRTKKKSKENTVDPNKEKLMKLANALLEIERCVRLLED